MRRRLAVALLAGIGLGGMFWFQLLQPDTAPADQPARHISSFTWTVPRDWFGGLSGIDITPAGDQITVLSDTGFIARAQLDRQSDRITGLKLQGITTLQVDRSRSDSRVFTDAEGLVALPSGAVIVSFERQHRLQTFKATGDPVGAVNLPPALNTLGYNTGLEALAQHPDGRLFTLPEKPGPAGGSFPLRVFDKGIWSDAGQIPQQGRFLPVGADFHSDGRLYVLERSVSPFGFLTRVRRFDLSTTPFGEETLLTTGPGKHDNLEGIAVWHNGTGLRLTLISDNNYNFFQRTEIVEYGLAE